MAGAPLTLIAFQAIATSVAIALGTSILATLFLRLLSSQKHRKRQPSFPPGPPGVPVIGNLWDMPSVRPWEGLRELNGQYGDVMGMRILGQSIVILGSAGAITQYLDRNSTKTSSRPYIPTVELLGQTNGFSLMPYGSEWRTCRRAFWQHFNPKAVPKYTAAIQSSVRVVLHKLLNAPERWEQHLSDSVSATLVKVVYDLDVKDENDEVLKAIELGLEGGREALIPGRFLVDSLPFLRFLPSFFPSQRHFARLSDQRSHMFDLPYALHKAAASRNEAGDCIMTDIISSIAGDTEDAQYSAKSAEAYKVAKAVLSTTFAAGLDTGNSILKTFFLAMSLNPDVQARAHSELDAAVGRDRLPDLEDREALPYLSAIFLETLRWMPAAPLGLVHCTDEDDTFGEYFVPANTTIIPNIWACMHDPDAYDRPGAFMPERFLRDGKLNPAVRNPFDFVFGFGRRVCPGRHYGDAMLFLHMACVLHVFRIQPSVDKDGAPIVVEPKMFNSFVSWPEDCRCTVVPRTSELSALI
ncbi:cytochrome P450 [Epithele typhae]|uniref:cytochrome P450 n=1 Tax=Epithele typhae TaxID=378194 RepID=UPI002007696E|nr:cytochrome P450 [Epithele typhae]KAH9924329.1 cytochrome P450 [Epithele typhae]